MKKKRHKGFTLIELLVVIAIVSILAAVALVALGSARGQAKDVRVRNTLKELQKQAEIYYSVENLYGIGNDPYSCARGFGLTDVTLFMQQAPNSLYPLIFSLAQDVNGGVIPGYTQNQNLLCRVGIEGRIQPPFIPKSNAWAIAAKLPGSGKAICVDSTGTFIEKDHTGQTLELWMLPRGDYSCPTQ